MPRKQTSVRKRTRFGEMPRLLCNSAGYAFFILPGTKQKVYCGRFGTPEAVENHLRKWNEYLVCLKTEHAPEKITITVAILVSRFLKHAHEVYIKNGQSTKSFSGFVESARPLVRLYESLPVEQFGPVALKAVRQAILDSGVCRKTINRRINCVRQIFKWGVENELVPVTVWQALTAVAGLKIGRTCATEPEPVEPIPLEIVEKTLPHMPPMVADMVRIQLWSGMRPQDVCNMRICDLDTSGQIWKYIPHTHKTEHKGCTLVKAIGKRVQSILTPYLMDKLDSP
ncbi:MAG: hypothetical protein ACRC2T_01760, partial [Thermoguttaceae bacterium]